MDESLVTFDRLVLTLESSERQELLRQIADAGELRQKAISPVQTAHDIESETYQPLEQKILEEPFFVRLWIALYSLLASKPKQEVYARHLVGRLGRVLERDCAVYIDVPQKVYTERLYAEFVALKKVQTFFAGLLEACDADRGGFYIVLGSLMMKSTHEAISHAANPFDEPINEEPVKDIRLTRQRALDAALNGVSADERSRMYQAARSIAWLRSFCALPIDRILLRFGNLDGKGQTCLIEAISAELIQLVNALASVRSIPVLVLEALHLFSVRDRVGSGQFDLEADCKTFVDALSGQLGSIANLKAGVPLVNFVRFTLGDVTWQPAPVVEGEDWFQLYRSAWKARFDEKFAQWNAQHRAAMLDRNIRIFLESYDLPEFPYRPWEGFWMAIEVRRETACRMLKAFFETMYPASIAKPLKILLIEGDFYRKENAEEFTESFSVLERQDQLFEALEKRLSPKGDLGESFETIRREPGASLHGKSRMESLSLTVNAEFDQIYTRILAAFRSVDAILGGVLAGERASPYDTLANLSAIQGKFNERYRRDLQAVRHKLSTAFELLAEIDAVKALG